MTLVINADNMLYVEHETKDFHGVTSRAVSASMYYPSKALLGIPEREDTLMLENTGQDPYQLWATDEPMHMPNNKQPLYGSVPYILAISQ